MIVFFPTGNDAKYKKYEAAMKKAGIDYRRYLIAKDENGNDYPVIIDNIPENGTTPYENACIKAKAYYDRYSPMLPDTEFAIMTTDEALYFDEWNKEDEKQPGRFVRRWLNGNSEGTSDPQLLNNCVTFVQRFFGNVARAHWLYSMVLYGGGTTFHSYEWKEGRLFCTTPHLPYPKGYPLDCISIEERDESTGEPIMRSQLSKERIEQVDSKYTEAVARFVREKIEREQEIEF